MKLAGFTDGLLQLSVANWIINYPIVMPLAANRHIGGIVGVWAGGGEGSRGWSRGRGVGGRGGLDPSNVKLAPNSALLTHVSAMHIIQ